MLAYLITLSVPFFLITKLLGYDAELEPYFSNAVLIFEVFQWLLAAFIVLLLVAYTHDPSAFDKQRKKARENSDKLSRKFFRALTPFEAIGFGVVFGDVSLFLAFCICQILGVVFIDKLKEEVKP